jgi:hypothetical protein
MRSHAAWRCGRPLVVNQHASARPYPTWFLWACRDPGGLDSWQALIHDGAVLESVAGTSMRGTPFEDILRQVETCGRPARLQVGLGRGTQHATGCSPTVP